MPTMAPSLLMRSMSVILTALADLTRNMTEILKLLVLLLEHGEVVEEKVEVMEEEVEEEVEVLEEEQEEGTMYNWLPPSFQHERAV